MTNDETTVYCTVQEQQTERGDRILSQHTILALTSQSTNPL